MKLVSALLVALVLSGCSTGNAGLLPTAPTPPDETTPAPPAPPPPTSGNLSVWVMVIGASGGCIDGATVEIVHGQGLGQKLIQRADCSQWDYGGGVTFAGLTTGVELTLRASAAGYVAEEWSIAPPRPGVIGPFKLWLTPSSP